MSHPIAERRGEAGFWSPSQALPPHIAMAADRQGAVALLAAIMLSALLFFTGLTVDFGLALFKKRELQAATDLAALAASQNIGNAASIVTDMMAANGFATAHILSVTPGTYDTTQPLGKRFVTGGQLPPDALMLSTSFDVPMNFVRAIVPNALLTVPAVAGTAQFGEAGLVAGSGLAALNGGLPNAILGKMLGSNISLDLVSYNGLANSQINALDFLDALATQLNLTAGTYGQVLSANASMGSIVNAEIAALSKPGALGQTQVAISGLQTLAAELTGTPTVALGTLFSAGIWQNAKVGTIDRNTALQAALNVYQVTSFAAQIANGSNLVSASNVLTIPPLTTLNVATTMIEPPQGSYFSIGPAGTTVHTSQVRLLLTFNLTTQSLIPLVPVAVTLPIYVEVASGTASLTSIRCGGSPGTDAQVGVSAISGVANAYVGTVSQNVMMNFNQAVTPPKNATLINLANIITATGSANGVGVSGNTVPLTFTQAQIDMQQSQRISSTNMTSNLLAGLQSMTLTVNTFNLPLLQLTVPALLTALLQPVFNSLDSVTDQVLSTLGVQVGYLDVTVTGDRCGVPALIQ